MSVILWMNIVKHCQRKKIINNIMINLKLKTKYSIMNEIYENISKNKLFDDNLNVYTMDKLNELCIYFENLEEYEKCQVIKNFIDNRFNHKLNYL
jgi:hypothetical protein